MKKLTGIILALIMCFSLMSFSFGDSVRDQYEVTVTANYWYHYTAFGGNLYVPYLKIEVKNKQSAPASKITLKVVFYDESKKEVWDEKSDYLVSSSDTPLRSGYSKTAFIQAGVGYKSQITASVLPDITAEIYINGEYYGIVEVAKTYSETSVSIKPAVSLEAIRQEEAEAEAGKTPEQRIGEECTARTATEIKSTCDFLNRSMGANSCYPYANSYIVNSIRYNSDTRQFACVSKGSYGIAMKIGGSNRVISEDEYFGYIGHLDGNTVVIEKKVELGSNSIDVDTFWAQNIN